MFAGEAYSDCAMVNLLQDTLWFLIDGKRFLRFFLVFVWMELFSSCRVSTIIPSLPGFPDQFFFNTPFYSTCLTFLSCLFGLPFSFVTLQNSRKKLERRVKRRSGPFNPP